MLSGFQIVNNNRFRPPTRINHSVNTLPPTKRPQQTFHSYIISQRMG